MLRPSWLIVLCLTLLPDAASGAEPPARGRGVTIAVLDAGFRGYQNHLGKELPARVIAKSFRDDGNIEARPSVHGILCAEVLHSLAPEADLLFANWEPDEPASFLRAVSWCREHGATIFSCSMVMPGWSDGRGGGEVHRQLSKCLAGALFFASAGNLANRHWSGEFRDDGRSRHRWDGDNTENAIQAWGGQPVSVELTWSGRAVYRARLIDSRGETDFEDSRLPEGNGVTLRFLPLPGHEYKLCVERTEGESGEFRLIVLGADLEHSTHSDCMVFPGDGAEILAVGAVDYQGIRLRSSSIGNLDGRVKPNCVATVPFACRIRSTAFGGTSAAAPQAAAAAAVLWSRDRQATAHDIRERLLKSCEDLGPPGPDPETGHGRVKFP